MVTNITELFRPKTRTDLVGNKKAIDKVEECIMSSKVCLLHGDAGIGKTSTPKALANDIQFAVREWNASDARTEKDFVSILREIRSNPFTSTIFILDEIDGIEDFAGLTTCIQNTRNPLVLICNNIYDIPLKVRELCEIVRFWPPTISEVAQLIKRIEKETGMKADYNLVGTDIRNSIINCFYGSEKYKTQTQFELIEEYFKTGKTEKLNIKNDSIWLFDNAHFQYTGKKMCDFYRMLAIADKLGNFKLMSAFKGGKQRIEYPRYIQRSRVLKVRKK